MNRQPHSRIVLQLSYTGIPLIVYESVSEASRKSGISRTAITNALNKKSGLQISGGYIWRYKSDFTDEQYEQMVNEIK